MVVGRVQHGSIVKPLYLLGFRLATTRDQIHSMTPELTTGVELASPGLAYGAVREVLDSRRLLAGHRLVPAAPIFERTRLGSPPGGAAYTAAHRTSGDSSWRLSLDLQLRQQTVALVGCTGARTSCVTWSVSRAVHVVDPSPTARPLRPRRLAPMPRSSNTECDDLCSCAHPRLTPVTPRPRPAEAHLC
jgi:hypothetical protein